MRLLNEEEEGRFHDYHDGIISITILLILSAIENHFIHASLTLRLSEALSVSLCVCFKFWHGFRAMCKSIRRKEFWKWENVREMHGKLDYWLGLAFLLWKLYIHWIECAIAERCCIGKSNSWLENSHKFLNWNKLIYSQLNCSMNWAIFIGQN